MAFFCMVPLVQYSTVMHNYLSSKLCTACNPWNASPNTDSYTCRSRCNVNSSPTAVSPSESSWTMCPTGWWVLWTMNPLEDTLPLDDAPPYESIPYRDCSAVMLVWVRTVEAGGLAYLMRSMCRVGWARLRLPRVASRAPGACKGTLSNPRFCE